MLTQDERDRLARWMGWTIRHVVDEWENDTVVARAEFDEWRRADGWAAALYDAWLNPPTGNDMLMLLEQLRAQKVEIRLDLYLRVTDDWFVDLLWRDDAGNCAGQSWGREHGLPLSVCRAILDMLEADER